MKPGGDDFEVFWSIYPRRVAKGAARKAFARALRPASPEDIITGAKRYSQSVNGREMKYIAHPATWLNQERWADDPRANIQDVQHECEPDQQAIDRLWEMRLEGWHKRKAWSASWGPEPGYAGCEVPARLLVKVVG